MLTSKSRRLERADMLTSGARRAQRAVPVSGHQDNDPDDEQNHTEDEGCGTPHAEPEYGLAEALPQCFLGAVADDETMPLFTGVWGPDAAALLHGAQHVDRLVDGKDALGVTVADGALPTA